MMRQIRNHTIIMTPAPPNPFARPSERNSRRHDYARRQGCGIDGGSSRLEDSICARTKLRAAFHFAYREGVRCANDPRIEDRPSRGERSLEDGIGRDFVTEWGIKNERARVAIPGGIEKCRLNPRGEGRGEFRSHRSARFREDRAKIFFLVRHWHLARGEYRGYLRRHRDAGAGKPPQSAKSCILRGTNPRADIDS